ncbi:hypothetical protein BHF71_02935 [Vulcanibacillus modesticaldus]|uniref:Uncharacterized protein n=1 Tax=Vulcanibacillus modesticaldus TaxID=337097 RepID=A0A1D2YT77_9BACI|nr:YlbG family protein [Vulcanibacillus modesticaldus]OEF98898.1 hypothetical protein BHF71_02935 [Vulcanibacillus modesticaldus]
MFPKRAGLIVWVNDTRLAKNLERFGNLLYISKRLRYAVLYVNESEVKNKITNIEKLHYVRRVERSLRTELMTDFTKVT